MLTASSVALCILLALVATSLHGCSMCNHSIPFTCSGNKKGVGVCSGNYKVQQDITSWGDCRAACGKFPWCTYYSFCPEGTTGLAGGKCADKGLVATKDGKSVGMGVAAPLGAKGNSNACVLSQDKKDKCTLMTKLWTGKGYETYQMYEKHEAKYGNPEMSSGILFGFFMGAVVSGVAVLRLVKKRSSRQALVEEVGQDGLE